MTSSHVPDARPPASPSAAFSLWLSAQPLAFWIWSFVALGIVVRLTRFLLRFPLWEDEAFLAYNLMNRGFPELLLPLDFCQVAPLGYLWLQRAVIAVLGFTEYSLRFTALLAGLGSLLIFRRLAQLVLPGRAQLFAVAVFAVSYPMIRYSAEAKQYGLDLFLSLALLWLFLEWQRQPDRMRWRWGLLGLAAVGPWLSHPLVFVGGAVSLVWGWIMWNAPDATGRRRWVSWLFFNLLLGASFGWHHQLALQAIGPRGDAFMQEYWQHTFPPWSEPLRLAHWLLATHAGDFLAYPLGSGQGGSILSLLAIFLGVWVLALKLGGRFLAIALAPLGLHFVAAALQKYPYGGHVKFGLYWAPLGALFLGAGLAAFYAWLDHRQRIVRAARLGLGALALIAAGILTRDFISPAKTQSDLRGRDFARWFWFNAHEQGQGLCLHADLGRTFTTDLTRQLNWFAAYACNVRIYSPRPAQGLPAPHLVSMDRPLHCVEYRVGSLPYDQAAQEAWLAEMGQEYQLVSHDSFPLARYDKHDRRHVTTDYLEVYRFVPRTPVVNTAFPDANP